MDITLGILIGCVAALLLVPVSVLFIEVLLAVSLRAGRRETLQTHERPRLAILIPAHDEAPVIGNTLRSILPQLEGSDQLLVVADNCADGTAHVARAEGVRVIERTDPSRRGKGHAIGHGLRHLAPQAPDVVIIIDADCTAHAGAIDRLARRCAATRRPVQALDLMRAPMRSSLKLRIAELAWLVKNQVRPTGLHKLGLPCHLMGTGMALPWLCISKATIATSHIVEDLQLGIELARMGTPPIFCPEALVTSEFPTSAEGIRSQRLRWEHGHLVTMVSQASTLLLQSIKSRDAGLATLALDLSVPPLSLLTLLVALAFCASVTLCLLANISLPLEITLAEIVMIAAAVILSWARYGRGIVSLRELAFAPIYVLWKLPVYGRFLVNRQRDWVRSRRN